MSDTGVAYSRLEEEQILTFEEDPGETGGLRDLETGSRWHALTGASIEGPLRKSRLEPLIATTAFEFGWFAYYPHSDSFRH